ncbi:MAG TPA: hypothetical protein VK158_05980 [Acidobacteriota bacterium]|nr:hypothetical protein [Acidobacteriota bacterium]
MTTIGFTYTKMLVERKSISSGKVSIQTQIGVTSVDEMKMMFGTNSNTALKIGFSFALNYTPGAGVISLEGFVSEMLPADKIKAAIDTWKAKKVLIDQEFMTKMMNQIYSKCQVQAILLAKEMSMPSPVPLPKIKVDLSGKAAPAGAPAKAKK